MSIQNFDQIWIAPYTLKSKSSLNRLASRSERQGVLLRVDKDGVFGYADLHPWTELGDAPLGEQLQLLIQGHLTPLTRRSLAFAELDWGFRSAQRSAFEGHVIPKSHFTITDLSQLSFSFLSEKATDGFSTLKLKVGRDLNQEVRTLRQMASELMNFRLRLDFNSSSSVDSYLGFLESLGPQLCERIEFVEDPLPWNLHRWSEASRSGQRHRVSMALDRVELEALELCPQAGLSESVQWLIIKPALQNPDRALALVKSVGLRVCVTSYLDHPFGQMTAAYVAAWFARETPQRLGHCGLLSHVAYEANEFSEVLVQKGPQLNAAAGTGFGFDALLERQAWKTLTAP